MISDGTKRKCAGGEHQIKYDQGVWHHMSKTDWVDKPHKASPRKYRRARQEIPVNQTTEGVRSPET